MQNSNTVVKYKSLFLDFEFIKPIQTSDKSVLDLLKTCPLIVYPKFKGVDIAIRTGFAHTLNSPHVIYNLQFKEMFNEMFVATRKLRGTLLCTLSSEMLDADELHLILNSRNVNSKLPLDCKLHLYDWIFESVADKLPIRARISMTEGLAFYRKDKNTNILFFKPIEVYDKNELLENLTLLSTQFDEISSICINKPDSKYTENIEFDTLEYLPKKEFTGILNNITTIVKKDGEHIVPVAIGIELLYQTGDEIIKLPIDIEYMTVNQRIILAKSKSMLINKTVVFSGIEDFNSKIPVKRKFISFK